MNGHALLGPDRTPASGITLIRLQAADPVLAYAAPKPGLFPRCWYVLWVNSSWTEQDGRQQTERGRCRT
jgi:hypothetical protein